MTLSTHHNGGVILAVFTIALVLSVMPLPIWTQDFRPQWVTLALLYWCLALPHRVGVGSAWLLGVLQDVLSGTLLGQHALGLSVDAYIVVMLHRRIRIFPLWQQSLTILVLLLLERLLTLWVMGATGQPTPTLWYWVPALVGGLLWPWVFIVLRDVRRRFQVT
jgi:rod shape-determining protein MreD